MPTKSELEKRVAELEEELAFLRLSNDINKSGSETATALYADTLQKLDTQEKITNMVMDLADTFRSDAEMYKQQSRVRESSKETTTAIRDDLLFAILVILARNKGYPEKPIKHGYLEPLKWKANELAANLGLFSRQNKRTGEWISKPLGERQMKTAFKRPGGRQLKEIFKHPTEEENAQWDVLIEDLFVFSPELKKAIAKADRLSAAKGA